MYTLQDMELDLELNFAKFTVAKFAKQLFHIHIYIYWKKVGKFCFI